VESTGLAKLPKSGPCTPSPNHQSFLDGPRVTAQLPFHIFKDLFYVGTSEIFATGLMRKLARSMKLIPVDPDANLVPAMRAGAFGLKRGKILVLYPEGERSIDGAPKIFKKGAAILAIHQNVPIVPVAIEGFHDVWPRGHGFQGLHPLQIAFGDPIYPPRVSTRQSSTAASAGHDASGSRATMSAASASPDATSASAGAALTPEAAHEQLNSELRNRILEMCQPLHAANSVLTSRA
jgi:1-acyl-sn-glycerol-3-phosphate acyltransferase